MMYIHEGSAIGFLSIVPETIVTDDSQVRQVAKHDTYSLLQRQFISSASKNHIYQLGIYIKPFDLQCMFVISRCCCCFFSPISYECHAYIH